MNPLRTLAARFRQWVSESGPRWLPVYPPMEPFTGAWQRNAMNGYSDQTLLAYSGVFACVTIIAGDVAKLPVHVYRVKPNGEREEATTHWAYRLFRKPNAYQTRFDIIQQLMTSVLLAGNGYLYFKNDERNAPAEMHCLDPRRVRYMQAPDTGDLFYTLSPSAFYNRDDVKLAESRDILHHRIFTLAHPLDGVTPLVAAAQSAATGLQIGTSSNSFFGNASRPSGILTAPAGTSEADAKRLLDDWKRAYGPENRGTGNPALLTADLKWQPLGMTAEDAQLIEQLRWTLNDVARCYRVPPFMLGDMEKMSYRNSEQLMRYYYGGCLQSQIEALENRFETFFDLGPDMEIEFDLDELLRTDLDVRYKAYQEAITSGFLTINEAREREKLPSIKGGDEPLVQMQYRPLSQAIKPPPAPAPAPSNAPTPPAADDGSGDGTDDGADGGTAAAKAEAERVAAEILARVMA
jgi:HK97 family phage portal protein